jgi:pSer/pThr/pTyr-binding forkhead associated (FHA) protein
VHNDERTPIDAEVSVGRADGNTIRLANDRAISRQHARFVVKSDGVWLEDLGSANGSYVNDNRVIQPVLLKDGDAVLLGNTAFAFEAPVAPAPAAEEEPALWPGATDRIRAAVPDEVEDIQEQTLQGDEAELYMREAELAQFQALRAGDTEPQAGLGRSAVDQYRLVINFGPETGREFPLYKDVTFIGRAAPEVDYEIQLNDRAVSRPHARIVKSAGGFVIEDVASANGTWLNYTEEIKVPRALADGDVLKLGKTTLVYRVPAAVRPPEPEIVLDPSQGQIISVFTLKGGVGTSTLAVNLAIVLHRITQQRVLLIDLATERGADTVHLNVTPKLTLADLPTDPSMIDEDVIHSLILSHSSGVDFLAAPPSPQTAELVTAAGITTLMPLARGKYKWVIIDTNPSFSELNLGVFDQSDLVLLLQSPDVSSLKVMQSSLDVFAALQTPPEKRVLVLNQTHPHPHITREDLEQSLGERIGVELPYAGDDVLDSIDRGVPLAVGRPEHPFVLAVESFASQLAEVKVAAVERPRKGGFGSWMQGLLGGLKR